MDNMQPVSIEPTTDTPVTAFVPATALSNHPQTEQTHSMPVILVVDDEQHICNIVEEYFTILGYRVSKAFTGKTGIKQFKADCPSIVITDMNITDCTGFDIARQVKSMSPETTIILITGCPIESLDFRNAEHTIDYILQKPIDFSALSGIVNTVTGHMNDII